jgi:hypothetical protein
MYSTIPVRCPEIYLVWCVDTGLHRINCMRSGLGLLVICMMVGRKFTTVLYSRLLVYNAFTCMMSAYRFTYFYGVLKQIYNTVLYTAWLLVYRAFMCMLTGYFLNENAYWLPWFTVHLPVGSLDTGYWVTVHLPVWPLDTGDWITVHSPV